MTLLVLNNWAQTARYCNTLTNDIVSFEQLGPDCKVLQYIN